MSRINRLLTCGVLAVAVTGCQSARTMTNHAIHWRPFSSEKTESTDLIAEQSAEQPAEAEEESGMASLEAVAEKSATPEQEIQVVSGKEESVAVVAAPPLPEEMPLVTSQKTTPPQASSGNSFEDFIRTMEAQEQSSDPTVTKEAAGKPEAEKKPAATDKPAVADKVAAAPVKKPESEKKSDTQPAKVSSELENQVEALLAEYRPLQTEATAPAVATTATTEATTKEVAAKQTTLAVETAEVVAEESAPAVQQAVLSQQNDAALVAYDLASFADVSLEKEEVTAGKKTAQLLVKESSDPSMSFKDWVEQSAQMESTSVESAAVKPAVAKSDKLESTQVESPFVEPSVVESKVESKTVAAADFPWAVKETAASAEVPVVEAGGEKLESVGVVAIEQLGEQPQSVEAAPEKRVTPSAQVVSADILKALEQALGSDHWKHADMVQAATQYQQDEQTQHIARKLRDGNYQTRLHGIRLTCEQGSSNPFLLEQVEKLLEDENAGVRAHAASALYHCQRFSPQVLSVLTEVMNSGDVQSAHLAAMFLGDMSQVREQVLPVLQTALMNTKDVTLLHVAESVLKHDPQNVDAVVSLSELMRNENVEVRWLAAHALGSVQGNLRPYAVEALRGGLRDIDSQVRATSALSLGGLGRDAEVAVTELSFIAAHSEPKVKDAAVIALDCIRQ